MNPNTDSFGNRSARILASYLAGCAAAALAASYPVSYKLIILGWVMGGGFGGYLGGALSALVFPLYTWMQFFMMAIIFAIPGSAIAVSLIEFFRIEKPIIYALLGLLTALTIFPLLGQKTTETPKGDWQTIEGFLLSAYLSIPLGGIVGGLIYGKVNRRFYKPLRRKDRGAGESP
ncbi:MFS family permease [Parvibaculum indicum]|uniref:hypothetical protein n=1 Tax=Parvibaculum indicum TaxID=562969 RepID=UPI00141FB98F|nr:hypothetical protein [Parvibaculum indicum]NIJ41245.1 MFS family permease [Parvibaculum indicum]